MKLNTQLRVSFGLMVLLLVITSSISYVGLEKTYTGFVEYRGLAKDTNLAGRVQANMLMMRLSVLSFINSRSEEKIETFDKRRGKMEEFLQQAQVDIQDPARARLIDEIEEEVDVYKKAFSSVVDLYRDRDSIVLINLDPAGLAMRVATTKIIESAYEGKNYDIAYYASRVQEHLLLGRLFVTKYLVTNEEDDAKRAIEELDSKMKSAISSLNNSIIGSPYKLLLNKIENNRKKYLNAFYDVKSVIESRNDYISNTLNAVGPVVAGHIEKVKLSVKSEQDQLGPMVQKNAENTNSIVAVVSIVAVIIGVICSILMGVFIRKPIGGEPNEIAVIVEKISKGDLSYKHRLNNNDTGIYKSVVKMSKELQELIRSMLTTSRSLTLSANNSSVIASENSERVLKQKRMTDQVVVAVEEMSASIQEIVNSASESSRKSKQGLKEASKGRESVQETLGSIAALSNDLSEAMTVIEDLEKQSNEIGSVVEVIQDISEQTNLLALNAAIEAARAGEQGRGFAVVADEVRTLAQRTQQSTTEIQTIIQNLQLGATKTVEVMEKSSGQAKETTKKSNTIDTALEAIQSLINDISDMNTQVAVAVDQQSKVTTEIAQNMNSISEQLDETTEAASEAETVSDNVRTLSSELDSMASRFKV